MQRLGKHSLSVVGEIHVGICVTAEKGNERNLLLVFTRYSDMNHPPKGTTSAIKIDSRAPFSPQTALAVRYLIRFVAFTLCTLLLFDLFSQRKRNPAKGIRRRRK